MSEYYNSKRNILQVIHTKKYFCFGGRRRVDEGEQSWNWKNITKQIKYLKRPDPPPPLWKYYLLKG